MRKFTYAVRLGEFASRLPLSDHLEKNAKKHLVIGRKLVQTHHLVAQVTDVRVQH